MSKENCYLLFIYLLLADPLIELNIIVYLFYVNFDYKTIINIV